MNNTYLAKANNYIRRPSICLQAVTFTPSSCMNLKPTKSSCMKLKPAKTSALTGIQAGVKLDLDLEGAVNLFEWKIVIL